HALHRAALPRRAAGRGVPRPRVRSRRRSEPVGRAWDGGRGTDLSGNPQVLLHGDRRRDQVEKTAGLGTWDWGLDWKQVWRRCSCQSLVVVLTHVVYSRHGRLASECCVRTVVVVMVQPLRERPTAFLVRPIELGIGPLGEQGLDEALGFAVGLGPVGADDLVTDLQAGDGFPEGARGDVAVR